MCSKLSALPKSDLEPSQVAGSGRIMTATCYTLALPMRLSVIIITRNESSNIADCLGGLGFADEVIVLDNASTDGTADIARALGAKVGVTDDWPGFGPQKNRVLALATGEWVLSIDADERVTPPLRDQILATIASARANDVYGFPRLSSYCGQFMKHSGWQPDVVVRLFRRGTARFSDDLVHERLVSKAAIGRLNEPLMHLSFPDFESVLDKVNRYSTAGAAGMARKERSASLWSAIGHGIWAFFRTYFIRRGFLDGQLGLALAISNAEGTYYRYAKRWLMTRSLSVSSDLNKQ
jgi:glycosyltransferase involved in cell wall biosynthesis